MEKSQQNLHTWSNIVILKLETHFTYVYKNIDVLGNELLLIHALGGIERFYKNWKNLDKQFQISRICQVFWVKFFYATDLFIKNEASRVQILSFSAWEFFFSLMLLSHHARDHWVSNNLVIYEINDIFHSQQGSEQKQTFYHWYQR